MSGRIRTIKPELITDRHVARLSDTSWRVYISLWLEADDYGNLPAEPELLHGQFFWLGAPRDIHAALAEIGHLVQIYEAEGKQYLHIRNWLEKLQRVDKPGKPRCPQPPPEEPTPSAPVRDVAQALPAIRETLARPSRDSRETVATPSRDLRETPEHFPPRVHAHAYAPHAHARVCAPDPDPDPDPESDPEHEGEHEIAQVPADAREPTAAAETGSAGSEESFEGYSRARVSDAVPAPSTGTPSPSEDRDSDARSRVAEPKDASEVILGRRANDEYTGKTSANPSHVASEPSPPNSDGPVARASDPMAMRRRIVAVLDECEELRGHIEDFDAFARMLQGQAGFRETDDAPLDEVTHYACLQLTTEVSQGKHKRPGVRGGIVRAIFRRLLNADEIARARGDDDEPDAPDETERCRQLARGRPTFGPSPPAAELKPITPVRAARFSGG